MSRACLVLVSIAALVATQASLASDNAEDTVGLASEPLPVINKNRGLTDAQMSTLAAALRDLTPSAVIEVLGAPELVELVDGDVHFQYYFGRPLRVAIQNGRVTGISTVVIINREEQERQTGVRDDDFVGLVGP